MKILFISNETNMEQEVQRYLNPDDEIIAVTGALEGISLTGIQPFDFVLINENINGYSCTEISECLHPTLPFGYYSKGNGIVEELDKTRKSDTKGFRQKIMNLIINWPIFT